MQSEVLVKQGDGASGQIAGVAEGRLGRFGWIGKGTRPGDREACRKMLRKKEI